MRRTMRVALVTGLSVSAASVAAGQACADDSVLKELRNATPVAATKGVMAWSSYAPRANRFRLVVARGDALHSVDVGRRSAALDVALGRDRGRTVALWSSCSTNATRSETVAGLLPDFSTGRGCHLRRYDVQTRKITTIDTGPGSAFLPAMTPAGKLMFFRRAGAKSQLISARLDGSGRRVLTRVVGSPTSLSSDGPTVAWTVSRAASDGNTSAVYVRSRAGQVVAVDRRGVALGGGVQLTAASLHDGLLTYLASGLGQSMSQLISYDLAARTTVATTIAPFQAVSAAPIDTTRTLVAVATATRAERSCPASTVALAPSPERPEARCALVITTG